MKNYYAIPYVSNSTLNWFKVSPRYCWKRMNLEIVDEEKSYTTLGKQLHMSILEPEEFEKSYTYLDFKAPASKQQLAFCESYVFNTTLGESVLSNDEALIIAYKESYVAEKLTDEAILKIATKLYNSTEEYINYLKIRGDYREVLSKSKQELITSITHSIKSHKKANNLIFTELNPESVQAFNELPIYWEYPIYYNDEGIKCKSLLDRLVVDHINRKVIIVDLKTSSTLGDHTDIILGSNYYRQLAFYRLAVQNYAKIPNDYEIESYIVTVTTRDPVECKVYKMSEEEFQSQVVIINDLMQQISWHWFTNNWDYSRAYYEGDGTENNTDEYSIKSFERNPDDGGNEIAIADVIH